jgi:hypothetical protein
MTQSGSGSLVYSTPLGGSNDSQANSVVTDSNGDIFVVGSTTSPNFPAAGHVNTGFEVNCWPCATNPSTADGFVTEITETAAPIPVVRMSAAQVDLGAFAVGATNVPPESVAIYNVGTAPLAAWQLQVGGPNSADFALLYAQSCSSAVFPGGMCSFSIGFTPSMVGTERAEVDISDNASPGTQVVQLTGVGNSALAVVTPLSLDFGSVPVGVNNVQPVSVTNTGNAALTMAMSLAGPNPGEFSYLTSEGCYPPTLAAGASCTLNIKFSPAATGTFSAFVSLSDNSGGSAGSIQTISLSGVGGPASPVVVLNTPFLNFAAQSVGTPSAAQSITVTNGGSAALLISSIGLTGTNAAEFQISPGQTTCTAGQTLAASATCFIALTFSPASLGSKQAALTISDNASPGIQQVVLSGTAVAPTAIVSVSSLAFGLQNVGTTSAPQTVTLSNTGNGSLTISSISIASTGIGPFAQNNTCGPVLYQNTQCNINLTYQPTATGNQFATLPIADNAVNSPQSVQLSGTGQAPLLTLSPAALTFSSQLVGTLSNPLVATVTNTSAAMVSGMQVSFGGANAGDFQGANNCGATLAAGGSCMVNVQFEPVASGTRTGILNLSYLGTGSPATEVLSGASSDYSITVVNSSAGSASVTASQTDSYLRSLDRATKRIHGRRIHRLRRDPCGGDLFGACFRIGREHRRSAVFRERGNPSG